MLLSYPITLIAGMPLLQLLAKLGIHEDLGNGDRFAGFSALVCLFIGSCVGWISGRSFPSLTRTGQWIWVLPSVVVLFDIVPALLRSSFSPSLMEYVYATGSNEGLGVVLLTLPVSSSLGYSAGMWFAKLESSHWAKAAALVGAVASFAAACALMVPIERRMVERDRRLLVVVRLEGIAISSDASRACRLPSTRAIDDFVVLRSVTTLESLEHTGCTEGPKTGIDRVHVLDGPHKGLEGWVLTSQVWRPLPPLELAAR